MLKYKKADLIAQAGLLVLSTFSFFLDDDGAWTVRFLILFAIVQLGSMIGHGSLGRQTWKTMARRIHYWGTWLVMMLLLIAFFKPVNNKYDSEGIELAIIATLLAAILAVLYVVITTIELKRLTKESLTNPEQ